MPTSTQTGAGSSYVPRNHFHPNSVVKTNLDSLEQIPTKAIGRAGSGSSTLCKVLTAIGALCVVGAAVGASVGLTVGRTTARTTGAADAGLTSGTQTTITTTSSTSTTATTSTTVTTVTTATTATTTTETTTTALQALSTVAQVTASSFYSGAGTSTTQGDSLVGRTAGGGFNAGGYAPQWIQLQLPGTYAVCNIVMLIGQAPNGVTQHQLSTGTLSNSTVVVSTFNGYTSAGQWLNATYNPCLTAVSFIRLNSISSPSWIAWTRFYVYGY